jgi:hypothetical protein
VELLEGRDVLAFLSGAEVVVGAGPGGPPLVQLIDPSTGVVQDQFLAFDSTFYGGVRVAVGDVTGDGYPDLVVAAGPGGGPQVKVYNGQTGAVVSSFFAYDSGFTGGGNVAIGDVYGNGVDEIITGPGTVGGPEVNVFNISEAYTKYQAALAAALAAAQAAQAAQSAQHYYAPVFPGTFGTILYNYKNTLVKYMQTKDYYYLYK